MKFEQSKEWYERMAKIEEECDCDISAGKPIFYPPWALDLRGPEEPPSKPKSKATTAGKRKSRSPVAKRRTTSKQRSARSRG